MSTGVRILLRRHVLQHDSTDKSNECSRDNYAQKSHEPNGRATDEIIRRRTVHTTDGGIVRITISAIVDCFTTLVRRIIIYTRTNNYYILTVTSIIIIILSLRSLSCRFSWPYNVLYTKQIKLRLFNYTDRVHIAPNIGRVDRPRTKITIS